MTTSPCSIAVLGAGRMGQGIALAFAYAGLPAKIIDMKIRDEPARLAYARQVREKLGTQLHGQIATRRITASQHDAVLARIEIGDAVWAQEHVLPVTDLIFEAVPEVMEVKQTCFDWLYRYLKPQAIVASTTSTFLVTELQKTVPVPGRFLNAHWLNPAHLVPLVEVSRSTQTEDSAVAALLDTLRSIGKTPVVCAPSAGYIVPRIQALAMNEAARIVEEGVATAEDVDLAIRNGFGLRFAVLGLLEFIDWGGCDILFYASRYLAREKGPRFLPPEIVANHMHEGRKGLRDGAGFYEYGSTDVARYIDERLEDFMSLLDLRSLTPSVKSTLTITTVKPPPNV